MDRHTSSSLDEYIGEIAEVGEQLWCRLAARVTAGRGKWEATFARGIWVSKSGIDDAHLVMDFERGIQVRTVRRMPVEFRWNAEMLGMQRCLEIFGSRLGNPHQENLHRLSVGTCTSRKE